MLVALKRGLLTRRFRIQRDGDELGELVVSAWRKRAGIELEGVRYVFDREAFGQGAFLLHSGERTLAEAVKPSAFRSRFEVRVGGRAYLLKKRTFWSGAFGVFDGEREVGTLRRRGFFARRVEIDLPEGWPVAARVFFLWLALIVWEREDAAAAGG